MSICLQNIFRLSICKGIHKSPRAKEGLETSNIVWSMAPSRGDSSSLQSAISVKYVIIAPNEFKFHKNQ